MAQGRNRIHINAVGDVSLRVDEASTDGRSPFRHVQSALSAADIVFGNLETVLSQKGCLAQKAVTLSVPPERARWLKEAGFSILNVANNHILDRGLPGLQDTLRILEELGLPFIGVHRPGQKAAHVVLERQGLRVGFLGYCEGGQTCGQGYEALSVDEERVLRDLSLVREQADLMVVSLHWGIEKVFYPSPKQVVLAHKLIDTGATIVLGHHPHVVQGIERYKDGLIAYSLGNFQFEFDPEECSGQRDKRTNQSVILSLELSKDGLDAYDIIPVMIDEHFAPYMPVEEKRDEIRHFISKISEPISLKTLNERWWFEEIAWEYLSGNIKSWIVRIKRYGFSHLLQCIRWLLSPFCVRCYVAIMRRRIKRVLGKT